MGHTYAEKIGILKYANTKRSRHSKLELSRANGTDQKVVNSNLNLIWPPFFGTSALLFLLQPNLISGKDLMLGAYTLMGIFVSSGCLCL